MFDFFVFEIEIYFFFFVKLLKYDIIGDLVFYYLSLFLYYKKFMCYM